MLFGVYDGKLPPNWLDYKMQRDVSVGDQLNQHCLGSFGNGLNVQRKGQNRGNQVFIFTYLGLNRNIGLRECTLQLAKALKGIINFHL